MANLTYNQRKAFGIQIFDIMENYFHDFNGAAEKTKQAMKANGTYTEDVYNDIIADMEQKYHKAWTSVHLTAHFLGTRVLLQVVGERGYVIEETIVNPQTAIEKRRKRFQAWLNEFNETYNSNFTLADITCVEL